MGRDLLPCCIRQHYDVREFRHACAILKIDFPQEWQDLIEILSHFTLPKSMILTPGGNKSPISQRINGEFEVRGWHPKKFDVRFVVDGKERKSPTHKVDYFKNRIAVETEWNNKDPFYDRDLNNFRLLFELDIISVGIIITRATELQKIFDELGKGKSYGPSTTHMEKLIPKIEGGGAGGCPLLIFGIRKSLYDPNA